MFDPAPPRRLFALRVNADVFYLHLLSLDGKRLFEQAGLPKDGRVVGVFLDRDRRDFILHIESEQVAPVEDGMRVPEFTDVTIRERRLADVLAERLFSDKYDV